MNLLTVRTAQVLVPKVGSNIHAMLNRLWAFDVLQNGVLKGGIRETLSPQMENVKTIRKYQQ